MFPTRYTPCQPEATRNRGQHLHPGASGETSVPHFLAGWDDFHNLGCGLQPVNIAYRDGHVVPRGRSPSWPVYGGRPVSRHRQRSVRSNFVDADRDNCGRSTALRPHHHKI